MPFDRLRIADWIERQVELDQIADPATQARIKAACLAIATSTGQKMDCFAFAKTAMLFWRGVTYGNRTETAELENPEADLAVIFKGFPEGHYHPSLRQFLQDNGVPLDRYALFAAMPEEVAFWLAGGGIPEGWILRHVYNTPPQDTPNYKPTLVFEGKGGSLWANMDGLHFTQSAGMVAVNPNCEPDFNQYPCIVKSLRFAVWSRFCYDPDQYFDEREHDQFGFVACPRVE
jgi:hypothetical protein